MSFPTRTLVIYKLSGFSLALLPFLRLIGKDIYYCEASEYFRRRLWLINSLERYGLRWIQKEYVKCSEFERGSFFAQEFADKIFNKIGHCASINAVDNCFSVPGRLRKKMDVLWKKTIYDFVEPFAHQYAAAVYLSNKNRHARLLVLSLNSLSSLLKDGLNKDIRIIVLPLFAFWGSAFDVARKKLSVECLRKSISAIVGSVSQRGTPQAPRAGEIDPENYEVAFFPHQGMFYGKLFIKDYFYNPDNGSPLFKSKILHVSLDEKGRDYMAETYRYYEKNRIAHLDINDFGYGKKKLFSDYARFLAKLGIRTFYDMWLYGPDCLMMASKVFYRMHRFTSFVSRLKKLKVALVGYDFLFPCELSLALMLKDVKVCANQERLIQAFYPQTYMIFDYYFIASRLVQERGLKNSNMEHCVPVGLVRVDKLFEYEKSQLSDGKYDLIKKTKKIVLALDYHVPANDYEDISRSVADVAQIRTFYEALILLAQEFPLLHIVIRGKFVESYASPYIVDIAEKINQMGNMEIEKDFGKYDPYYISEKADITIACHTSLADELLAAGRKVIFYEMSDYLEMNFDYDKLPLVAKDYKGLKYHVQNFLNGTYLDEDKINKLKNFYSDCYHGNVHNHIQTILGQLLRNQNETVQV